MARSTIFGRTIHVVMKQFQCSAEDAQRYIDLRSEGYSIEQAAVYAGIQDPPSPKEQQPQYSVGKIRIPLFAACGDMYEILNLAGEILCVIRGNKEDAQQVVDYLNEHLKD